ncbi:MAG: tRNA (adenosine(37)-N6)-threonylcarbamoyltransferase complex ATPase subunit type 1 TsaE [bacterium]|nr:tRNA (adenosine(37)-N6)-threonylcarbamoyltransferase complex ATPase subunit type 1 TsaE [bacterium]
MLELETGSAEATQRLAERIGGIVAGPLLILLSGDYGTGKTTFVQGLARGLGISSVVRSPSYNIMKRYEGGRLPLVHADLYRTAGEADIEELGLIEETAEGILAVEWPKRDLPAQLGLPWLHIEFRQGNGDADRRVLLLSWEDEVATVLGGMLG